MGSQLEAGVTVGDFRIEARAGVGGMGVVYRARQLSLDRVVALKVLGGALTSPTDVARFRRAATAAARLSHPHIAAVHFVGQDDQVCYLAMEYVDGRSLQEVIRSLAAGEATSLDAALTPAAPPTVAQRFDSLDTPTTDLPTAPSPTPTLSDAARTLLADPAYQRRCVEIVRDAALALHHAHEQGVIHRDVKPGNLMLDRGGAVKVIDFGVARFFEDSTLTATGSLVGTPLYMSPEQVTGRIELTAATDIYSLGLVLIEFLTLRPPLAAGNREELLRRIVTKQLVSVRRANPAVPAALEAVAHTAAAKDADERYVSAHAFAADLQTWLDGKPVAAKPYRASVDEQEITASCPPAVRQLGTGLWTGSLVHVILGLFMFFLFTYDDDQTVYIVPGMLLGTVMAVCGLLDGLAGHKVLHARPTARGFALAATLSLSARIVFYAGCLAFVNGFNGRYRLLIYLLPVFALVPLLTTPRVLRASSTRDWFALAARMRAEAAGTMPAEGYP